MFSPATRKLRRGLRPEKEGKEADKEAPPSSPLPSIPSNRPISGTPAPWSSRLSVPARFTTVQKTEKGESADQTQPVFVGEFPEPVRTAQANLLQKNFPNNYENRVLAGGIDKDTCLAWMICGTQVFIWSYLSAPASKKCVSLEVPSSLFTDTSGKNQWIVRMVQWDNKKGKNKSKNKMVLDACNSVGLILCNQRTQAVGYWPDIYFNNKEEKDSDSIVYLPEGMTENQTFSSMIAAPVAGGPHQCVAIACEQNSGALYLFELDPAVIRRTRISETVSGCNARSLIWEPRDDESYQSFFLLMNHEIQCWSITFSPEHVNVTKMWAHVVVGSDSDFGIKKDLAGQKNVWLLDLQSDDRGKELSILVATYCKDRISSSNYIQYSLLTMLYNNERFLEKKAPLQVIIPKARVEDENFLFSMRLRIGGKPSGSVTILSADGTATVANYWRGSTRLYQFDLPWDAGKVLDASIFPSAMEGEEGGWVVLTEKAGVWAIPEKAVLVGGVEPPERSLSRKSSFNEGVREEERKTLAFNAPRRASSEAWAGAETRQRQVLSGFTHRAETDEEAEALLSNSFLQFVSSGKMEYSGDLFDKLRSKGAFEKEGETNVFARTSRSIVDTLAKHWTTTRGADFVGSTVISALLSDKQQRHQKFLQFLAFSRCHGELSSKQRYSMLNIMEHGEKLAGMIKLRELQNTILILHQQEQQPNTSELPSSVWKLIQLVGERARRNNVLLMDRDNIEVFYSKVSDIEDLFDCLSHYIGHVIDTDLSFLLRAQEAIHLSNACISIIQSAMEYQNGTREWYPSPEGLVPWNGRPVVRSGLWSVASFIMEIAKEGEIMDFSVKTQLWSQLLVLTDLILEGYFVSVTAKVERGEDSKGILAEYHRRRDILLESLYSISNQLAHAKYQESCKGGEDMQLKDSIYREFNESVMQIAMRHGGYQTLWDICFDLSDTDLLRNLMNTCGGFSKYAFEQLIKKGQNGKLLRLGEEFGEELAVFLKERKDLLWLHQLFLNDFSSASDTLHAFALSPSPPSLSQRRRLLYLSKISALAGKNVGFETKIGRIEADLCILKLQEEIMQNLHDSSTGTELIPPAELISQCLKNTTEKSRDLCLKAFEVFAWTSSSFRKSNRTLLEQCWTSAAGLDDWPSLSIASTSPGWTDDLMLQSLRDTVLFHMANRCYGPSARVFDGSFEEVLPLHKDNNSSSSSVEQVLMQHSYFADAGKLMLAAVVLGKESALTSSQPVTVSMES